MENWQQVERRTLLTEASSSEPFGMLYLDTPVLLEAGQRYRVDFDAAKVVVQDAEGHQQSFPGNYGDPETRPR